MGTDVAYVLVLLQSGAVLLGATGEALFMGSALYVIVPLIKAVVAVLFAAKGVAGRRWALIALIALEGLSLLGAALSTVLGLVPGLTRTVTLAGLLTEVALPFAVIMLCAQRLGRPGQVPA